MNASTVYHYMLNHAKTDDLLQALAHSFLEETRELSGYEHEFATQELLDGEWFLNQEQLEDVADRLYQNLLRDVGIDLQSDHIFPVLGSIIDTGIPNKDLSLMMRALKTLAQNHGDLVLQRVSKTLIPTHSDTQCVPNQLAVA